MDIKLLVSFPESALADRQEQVDAAMRFLEPLVAAQDGSVALFDPNADTEKVKRIDIAEFRRIGYLQEANRLFFHLCGLALEVVVDDDGSERLGGVWDYRDDPEGMVFGDMPDSAKAIAVREERARHEDAREALMGEEIQPLDWRMPLTDKKDSDTV